MASHHSLYCPLAPSEIDRMIPTLEQFVGNTPLARLQRIPGKTSNVYLAKLEGNNPAGSVKDRPAMSMVLGAERRGEIAPGDTLIEATSGNTGIALAMVGAAKGYAVEILMSESASIERRHLIRQLGARVRLFKPEQGYATGIQLARRMAGADPRYFLPLQFENPLNALDH